MQRVRLDEARYVSPCGELVLGVSDGALVHCDWAMRTRKSPVWDHAPGHGLQWAPFPEIPLRPREAQLLVDVRRWLDAYFQGQRPSMDVPIRMYGTPFQQRVWQAVREIPYGTTITYAQLAARLGMPEGARAVAGAVGANVLALFVPCHRVVGADGRLTGYSGGLEAKRFLLDLEK